MQLIFFFKSSAIEQTNRDMNRHCATTVHFLNPIVCSRVQYLWLRVSLRTAWSFHATSLTNLHFPRPFLFEFARVGQFLQSKLVAVYQIFLNFQMRVAILLLALILGANSHKILVYNVKFGHSHSNYLGNLADILVEAGHDVVSWITLFFECLRSVFFRPPSSPKSPHPSKTAPPSPRLFAFHHIPKLRNCMLNSTKVFARL